MENPIMISIAATVLFVIVKFFEMKFVEKEARPMKYLVRDALIVFASALVPTFAFFQMSGTVSELIGGPTVAGAPTQIFTDTPGF
jgi:DMSO reductase anchor subunit